MSATKPFMLDKDGRAIEAVRDGRGGWLCPFCLHGPFKTPLAAFEKCPNKGGRNHP